MLILYIAIVYISSGVLFAIIFLTRLIHRLDEGAEGAPWSFKLIIFPGCVIFWPVLLKKYITAIKTNIHD